MCLTNRGTGGGSFARGRASSRRQATHRTAVPARMSDRYDRACSPHFSGVTTDSLTQTSSGADSSTHQARRIPRKHMWKDGERPRRRPFSSTFSTFRNQQTADDTISLVTGRWSRAALGHSASVAGCRTQLAKTMRMSASSRMSLRLPFSSIGARWTNRLGPCTVPRSRAVHI